MDFYKKMVISNSGSEHLSGAAVTSKVGRTDIHIDQNVIAKALEFRRPTAAEINYPRPNFVMADEINDGLYTDSADARDHHRPGKFKEEYKLINQLVHHNLNPRGTENKPSKAEGKMLYAFMQPGVKIDWSAYIFKQLIEFKANAPTQTRMPFSCLITKICFDQGVSSVREYAELTKLESGIINSTILTKSISQSRIPRGMPGGTSGGSYLTTMPPRNAKKPIWYKKLFSQGVSIIESLRKEKKERREMARKQTRMDHRLVWLSR